MGHRKTLSRIIKRLVELEGMANKAFAMRFTVMQILLSVGVFLFLGGEGWGGVEDIKSKATENDILL